LYTKRLKRVPLDKRAYVDECGINTCLQREYARSSRGEKVEDTKRGKKCERVNVIGARCKAEQCAVEWYNHTTNSEFFEQWFVDCLLEEIPHGYTLIMDNAQFHRKAELRTLARGKVRLLFLPPYSPDYNPIEKTWANMKRFLCDNMQDFSSVDSAIYEYFRVPYN
jgi:hypothetical protein